MTTEEIWKKHPQHTGFEFSSLGRYRNASTGHIRKSFRVGEGRGNVTVEVKSNTGERVRNSLGKLMLETFVGPAPDGLKLTHRDGDPGNNRLDNLHWGQGTKYNMKGRICEVEGCGDRHRARGFCDQHWRDWRKTNGPRCSIPDCHRAGPKGGLCSAHRRWVRIGKDLSDPIMTKSGPIPEGEWSPWYVYKGDYTYRYRNVNGGRENQAQHRHVMEEHLGRKLRREETVHHINGVRHDNRLENLELWSSSHPAGQRVEDKVAWAEEILNLYNPGKLKGET